jgi:hypothetical protein
VREAEGIFKIEVPDNVRKIVIVKAQVHGVMYQALNMKNIRKKNSLRKYKFPCPFFISPI